MKTAREIIENYDGKDVVLGTSGRTLTAAKTGRIDFRTGMSGMCNTG